MHVQQLGMHCCSCTWWKSVFFYSSSIQIRCFRSHHFTSCSAVKWNSCIVMDKSWCNSVLNLTPHRFILFVVLTNVYLFIYFCLFSIMTKLKNFNSCRQTGTMVELRVGDRRQQHFSGKQMKQVSWELARSEPGDQTEECWKVLHCKKIIWQLCE